MLDPSDPIWTSTGKLPLNSLIPGSRSSTKAPSPRP